MIGNEFDSGSLCPMVFVVGTILYVGSCIVARHPAHREMGVRIAGGAFLFLVLEGMWRFSPQNVEDLVGIAMRAMAGAAVALGLCWIGLPTVVAVIRTVLLQPIHSVRSSFQSLVRAIQTKQRDKITHRENQRRQAEWDRDAPHRQQREQEQQRIQAAEAERQANAQRRREDARVACNLLYNMHAPEISGRLPVETVRQFIETWMGDQRPIELVEQRAMELQRLIEQHVAAVSPPERFQNLVQLTEWYEEQKRIIHSLNVADLFKRTYLVQLNMRFSELSDRILRRL